MASSDIFPVLPDLPRTGLLNTLVLAVCSAAVGTVLGMGLAVLGLSATTSHIA